MQTQSIECQIAQAQLKRYLMGEELPYALVTDLETHLKNCPECMAIAQKKRDSLKGVLTSEITGKKIAQPKPVANKAVQHAAVSGMAAVETPTDVFNLPDSHFKGAVKTKTKTPTTKTVVYSIGLAAMLVLMSTVFKDPTKFFGPRASTIQTDTPPAVETAPPITITENKPTTIDPAVSSTSEPLDQPVAETTTQPTTEPANPEANTSPATTQQSTPPADEKLATDGFIVADSVEGTKVVKKDPTPQPKPAQKQASKPKANKPKANEGSGSIKVYPPDSK